MSLVRTVLALVHPSGLSLGVKEGTMGAVEGHVAGASPLYLEYMPVTI